MLGDHVQWPQTDFIEAAVAGVAEVLTSPGHEEEGRRAATRRDVRRRPQEDCQVSELSLLWDDNFWR